MTHEEEWRPVPGFSLYEVSSHGNIRHTVRKKLLIPRYDGRGYLCVTLRDGPKKATKRIHAAVLHAFRGPRPHRAEGRHLDGNSANNRLSNLVWGSPQENSADREQHGRTRRGEQTVFSKLSETAVKEIRQRFSSGERIAHIARAHGVNWSTVNHILAGRTWRHVL